MEEETGSALASFVAWLPLLLLIAGYLVWYRHRIRADAKILERMAEQSEIGRLHLEVVERQTVELKRIADALERRGG